MLVTGGSTNNGGGASNGNDYKKGTAEKQCNDKRAL